MNNLILTFTILLMLQGCATLKDSLITGAAIGATGGGLLGNSRGVGAERHRNTNKGALIGAALGMGISYLAHQSKIKNQNTKATSAPKNNNKVPLLTRPKVKRVWVDDKIQGKRFVRGHWEYIIEEQSAWSKK